MAWEQRLGEPEGDPTPYALCSGAGSHPLLMLDHAANQPNESDSLRSLSIVGILSYERTFFSACFYHLNSDCDNKNSSQETFWGVDEDIFKEHWKKINNHVRLAINTKLNRTICNDAPYK